MELYKYSEDGEYDLELLPLDVDKLRRWESAPPVPHPARQRRDLKDCWQLTFSLMGGVVFVGVVVLLIVAFG